MVDLIIASWKSDQPPKLWISKLIHSQARGGGSERDGEKASTALV
jgi:hypothetical protein